MNTVAYVLYTYLFDHRPAHPPSGRVKN